MAHQIYLAPLQGLTHEPFREQPPEYFPGVDRAYTPYFSINEQTMPKPKKVKAALEAGSKHFQIVPQVLTNSSAAFLIFSGLIKDSGINLLNLNMGCPYPVVTKKGKGAAMLTNPAKTEKFFDTVFNKIQTEVSIKVRSGLHQEHELSELLPILNRFPFKEIIIHPRKGTDYYTGKPDMEAFSGFMAESEIPVVFNGDIFSVNDYRTITQRYPEVRNIMIGRGLLRNPLLAASIKNITIEKPNEQVKTFMHELAEVLSAQKRSKDPFPQGIKEYWWHLSFSFSENNQVFDIIKVTQDLKTYHQKVDEIFDRFDFKPGKTSQLPI